MSGPQQRWHALSRFLFSPTIEGGRRSHYLAVLGCFAQALFEPALNLEQLTRRLRHSAPELAEDEDRLMAVLNQLREWQHLEESRDDSATYRDPTEFRQRTTQWSLTADGQAVIAGLDAAADRLEAVASLQPAALDAIAAALAEVATFAAQPDSDNARMHLRLNEAEHHHRTLVDNLRAFTSDVQRLLSRADIDDQDLHAAKGAIVDYLNRYVLDAAEPARRVAVAINDLGRIGLDVVVDRAVAGANLAPGLSGEDVTVRATSERRRNLDALVEWFVGAGDRDAQFAQLLPRGRDAILRFMRVLELRREQRRRAASLADDFRALTRAFASCATRSEAHRMWMAAFGLHAARHHHLAADDVLATIAAGTPAAHNPPAPLDVELRRSPKSTGRPRHSDPVPDARMSRAARQQAQARALLEHAQARARLQQLQPTRLSTYTDLDEAAFDDLLDLLAQGLGAAPDDGGVRRTVSTDGQVEVVIYPPDNDDVAVLACARGRLTGPDLRVSVRVLGVDVATGQPGWASNPTPTATGTEGR